MALVALCALASACTRSEGSTSDAGYQAQSPVDEPLPWFGRTRGGAVVLSRDAAGADGLIVEVHPVPEKALSDGQQSLTPGEFAELMTQVRVIAGAIGRPV